MLGWRSKWLRTIGVILAACLISSVPACAGEGGTGSYYPGFQDVLAGVLPPPGTYVKQYFLYYEGTLSRAVAEAQSEANLRVINPVSLTVIAHVTKKVVLGSTYAFELIVPAQRVSMSGQVESSGTAVEFSDSRTGLSDIVLVPIMLGWHSGRSHSLAQFEVYVPTGNYSIDRLANVAQNRWAIELDYCYTFLDPESGLEVDLAPGYTIPFRNSDTDYLSGQELHLDLAALKRWPNKLGLGLSGYAFWQITPDAGSGATLGSFKGRVFGLGPLITYDARVGDSEVMLIGKYISEFGAKNRWEGSSAWLELAFPL